MAMRTVSSMYLNFITNQPILRYFPPPRTMLKQQQRRHFTSHLSLLNFSTDPSEQHWKNSYFGRSGAPQRRRSDLEQCRSLLKPRKLPLKAPLHWMHFNSAYIHQSTSLCPVLVSVSFPLSSPPPSFLECAIYPPSSHLSLRVASIKGFEKVTSATTMNISSDIKLNIVLHIGENEERIDYWRTVIGGVIQEDRLHHVSGIRNEHPVVCSSQTRITVYHEENMDGPIVQKLRNRTLWCCPHCSVELTGGARCKQHIQGVHENYRPYNCTKPGCNKAFGSKHGLEQVSTLRFKIALLEQYNILTSTSGDVMESSHVMLSCCFLAR